MSRGHQVPSSPWEGISPAQLPARLQFPGGGIPRQLPSTAGSPAQTTRCRCRACLLTPAEKAALTLALREGHWQVRAPSTEAQQHLALAPAPTEKWEDQRTQASSSLASLLFSSLPM